MAWKLVSAMSIAGSLFAANVVSLRQCSSPIGSNDIDGGGVGAACAVGSTQTCNTYGTQTCVVGPGSSVGLGGWGPCSCPPSPVCTPQTSQDCGNCGHQACDACGQWGACVGQGLCTPGDQGPDGCYEGEDAFCNAQCQWVCP